MELQDLVDLLPWGVAYALFMAGVSLREGLRERVAARPEGDFLSPALQLQELAPYSGPPALAVAALRERGIPPEQVGALLLFRGEAPGLLGVDDLPVAVSALVRRLWTDGAARGPEVGELLRGGGLPPGTCLWFVQLTSPTAGRAAHVVAFAGPDRGASDHA
jgi:hypothetical protein